MTIAIWLHYAIEKLEEAGIPTARLDSQVLLADAMKQDRSWVLAHMDITVTDETRGKLENLLDERAKHIPLAYIRGKTEFYGREFLVDQRVLEPRPESEMIIDILKGLHLGNKPLQIIDVGTGSGALAITAKLELPKATVTAIDIDPGCLAVAQANAAKHRVHIDIEQGDLLTQVQTKANTLIVTLANLPYVPDSHQVNEAALQEPHLAIFGGPDGLDPYRKLFEQAAKLPHKPSYILTECLPPQHRQLALIAARFGFRQTGEGDFIQVFEGGHRQGVAYSHADSTAEGQPQA
jgi:release factor glutamine methyltransferase